MNDTVRALVMQVLADFNTALRLRDIGVADSFHRAAIFVGSEPGEEARGRDQIAALFGKIFAGASTVQFNWTDIAAGEHDGVIWFQAAGEVVIAASSAETRRPYRLTGVLVAGRKGLRWRLFHGSEPWLPPAGTA